tara:strand:+ start:1355 stop:1996 length:642 start_codon:yes stop_codon:yes gene_type:complete
VTQVEIKIFLFLLFYIFNFYNKLNAQNFFSEILDSKIIIEDKSYKSLSISIGLPINIVKEECKLYFEALGNFKIEKKIIYHNIYSNSKKLEKINLKTSILKKKKNTVINTTSEKFNNEDKKRIQNLFEGIKIVLKRKFYQDYIYVLERKIKNIDKQQNRLIRIQPKLLNINKGFSYKLYQKNKVKKQILKVSLEKMYDELEKIKMINANLIQR